MENVPVVIGRYRLSKTLGIGAFGKVKLGEHTLTGHKVAVKILNRGKIKALDMEEKVKREINILKLCRHPHIVRLHEIIDTPSDIFMVMEYAPNGELFDYIVSKGRPSIDEAQRLFQQIVAAVEYCHFHHIVHRDLKPENLLLDQDNNLKIADFGLSNMMRDGEFLRTSCGSPNYAAPEVIMGTLYAGPEVDVWSCGVILYALLCGSLPFDDESIPSLFKKIKSGMYSLPSHLSPLTRDLVPRMLIVDPMKRITIAEIKQHPWFLQTIPLYLTLTPAQLEHQTGKVDEEVVNILCKLPMKGITRARILAALAHKGFQKKGEFEHEIRVVYELIQGNKLHKERLKQYVSANKVQMQTPPAFTPGSRGGGSGSVNSQRNGACYAQEAANVLRQQGESTSDKVGSSLASTSTSIYNGGMTGPDAQQVANLGPGSTPLRRRRWYLGIQSKKDPAHVMTEVYRALLQLGCEWRMLSSYRIQCIWRPDSDHATTSGTTGRKRGGLRSPRSISPGEMRVVPEDSREDTVEASGVGGDGGSKPKAKGGYRVITGLTLYKVQVNIYLLDFHKREGDQFTFMTLCAKIIIQLKTLSAQSKMQVASRVQPMPIDQRGTILQPQMQQIHEHDVNAAYTGVAGGQPRQAHQQQQRSQTSGTSQQPYQSQPVSSQNMPQVPRGVHGQQAPVMAPTHQQIQHGYAGPVPTQRPPQPSRALQPGAGHRYS